MNRLLSIFFLSTALVSLTINMGHAMESPEKEKPARPARHQFEFEREDQYSAKQLLTGQEIQSVNDLFAPLTNLLRGFYLKNEFDALVNACLKAGISFPKALNDSFDAFYNVGTNSRGLIVRLEALIPDFLRTAQTNRYLAQGEKVPQWAIDIAEKMKGYDLPQDSVYQSNKTQFMGALSAKTSEGLSLLTSLRATMAYHRVLFEDHPSEVLTTFDALHEKLNVMHKSMKDNGLRRAFEAFESKLPALMPMLRYEKEYASQNPLPNEKPVEVRISDAGATAIEDPYTQILPWLNNVGGLITQLADVHNKPENPYRRDRLFSAETGAVIQDATAPQTEGKPTGRLAQNIESVEKVLNEAKNLWAQVALAARREAVEGIPHPKRTYFMSKAQEQANTVFQNNLPRTLELLAQLTEQLSNLESGSTDRLSKQTTITRSTLREQTMGLKMSYLNQYRTILESLLKLKDEEYPALFASFKESEPHLREAALYTPSYVERKAEAAAQRRGGKKTRPLSADLSGSGAPQIESEVQPQSGGRARSSSDTSAEQRDSGVPQESVTSVIDSDKVKKMQRRFQQMSQGKKLQRAQAQTFTPGRMQKVGRPQ